MTFIQKIEKKVHQTNQDRSQNVKLSRSKIQKLSGEPTAWMTFKNSS